MVCVPETTIGFQLPLSGSLYEKFREWPDKIAEVRAFNSLSRDHTKAGRLIDVVDHFPFNSLSRDHAPVSPSPFGGDAELSTPSLGITEPDSGIFRLSAAFCRGTPSHK